MVERPAAGKRTRGAATLLLLLAALLPALAHASIPRTPPSADPSPTTLSSGERLNGIQEVDGAELSGFSLFESAELPNEGLGLDLLSPTSTPASQQTFHPLQALTLLDDEPLRGPPSFLAETRIGVFELSPPFLIGGKPRLRLEVGWVCDVSWCEIASGKRKDPLGLGVETACLENPLMCAGVLQGVKDFAWGILTAPGRLMERDYQEQVAKARAYNKGGMAARNGVSAAFTKEHNAALKEMAPIAGTARRIGEAYEEGKHSGMGYEFGRKLVPVGVGVVGDATLVSGLAGKAMQLGGAVESVAEGTAAAPITAIVKYDANFAAQQMGAPVEIRFPARGLTAGEQQAFGLHLAEQEAELNRLSMTAQSDLESNLLNFENLNKLNARARRLARGYLPGDGTGLDAAHKLDAVAGGYLNNFVGFRDPVQELIGSLWRTRAQNITPGRVHRLIPEYVEPPN